jgi:energy-coupling factor transporter ATP-binding protein EcfA2
VATVMSPQWAPARTRAPLIELVGVEKVYRNGKLEYPALRGVDLSIDDGHIVAIVGPSGSGKSTIMNMITGIDRPTAGTVTVRGERIDRMNEEQLAVWRGRHVGALLALLALGTSVGNTTREYYDDLQYDIFAGTVAARPFNPEATRVLRSTPGVRRIQPLLSTSAKAGGKDVVLWGTADRPLMNMQVADGRWYTPAEGRRHEPVAVLGRQLANQLRVGPGDSSQIKTPAGTVRTRVIGVSDSQGNNGLAVYIPMASVQTILGAPGEVNNYWIVASSKNHAFIDRLTTRLENTLGAHGAQITTMETYVARRTTSRSTRR